MKTTPLLMTTAVPKSKPISRYCAILAGGIGAIGLTGWIFDIPALERIHPALVTMKANTAIALMLASCSLQLLQDENVAGLKRWLAQLLAALIALLGLLTMGEHLFGWDLGIDQFFFRESLAAAGQSFQGRMGIASTVVFMSLGIALMVLDMRLAGKYWAPKLASVAGLATTVVFLYYFYGIEQGEAINKYVTIALHTVVAFYALCVGVLFARPERGIMRELQGASVGSVVARRMLPAAFFLPIVLGWLITLAEDAGLFGSGFGTAVFVVLIILVFTGLIRWTVIAINRQEAERKGTEVALRRSEANLRDFVENAPVGLHWVGRDGIIIWANQTELNLLGYTREEYVGHSVAEFHADASVIEDILCRLTQGELLNEYAARLRCKDGSIRQVLINSNVRFDDGEFIHTRCFTRDITGRGEAEAAQAMLAAIVMSCNDAILSKSLDGIITSWNPGAERTFGYTAEEMIGQSILRLIPPDLTEEETDILARLKAGEAIDRYETERVTKEGVRLAVSLTTSPIYGAQGNIIGVSKIVRDITERKHAETTLIESEQRFRALVTATSDVVYRMNPNWTEMLWLDGQDFVSDTEKPSLTWLQEYIHPDDQAQVMETIHEAIRTKSIFEMEHQIQRVDGSFGWTLSRAIPLMDANGEIVEWFGTLSDETARKQAEEHLQQNNERMRLATEATAVGIWEWNVLTHAIRWDAQMFRLYGIEPTLDGFVEYTDWSTALLPEDLPENERILHDTVHRCGQSHREFRIRRRNDGEVREIDCVETVRMNEHGQAEWVLGTNLDVTERKQAEAALKNALVETQRSARAKDDFLAALSHELRTPLTPVLMMATALGDDPELPSEVREKLAMMRRNIEMEARLIDDLLDLTRVSRGKLTIEPVITDVHELLNHTAEIVLSDRLGKEVSIVFKQEAERHHVLADPTRLQQVFWNLIKNAIKFAPSGGNITVSTRNDAAGTMILTVADNGVGIRAEALPHIFTAFEQGDVAGQHRYGGLGLGLAISKAIMDVHGGTITAESEGQDLGATFTVRLASVAVPTTGASLEAGERAGAGLRLLVVEDHETTRMVLAQLLSRRGHQVTTSSTAQEALRAYEDGQFDAVISDLGLPDGSGLDLMREIQLQRPVAAIALSGYGMEDDVRRTREAGFFAHLVKPVNIDQLRQLIDQIKPQAEARGIS